MSAVVTDVEFGVHAVWTADGAFEPRAGIGGVPARSPYHPGDWVRRHGYPGEPEGRRRAFRGFVLGGMGSTILWGLTDDGAEWWEQFGHLDPDGPQPVRDRRILPCVCCPPPVPDRGQIPGQTSLFGESL